MKKSKFTESEIIGILKQAGGGAKVHDLAREHGENHDRHAQTPTHIATSVSHLEL